MDSRAKRGEEKPETFEFLGFTHICACRRNDGCFTIMRNTLAKRLRTKVHEVTRELKRKRHDPLHQQGMWVRSVVRGYFNYHAVPGNYQALNRFRKLIARAWVRALRRRSQKGHGFHQPIHAHQQISPISTFARPSTTCAPSWTATAALSCTGRSARA